MLRKKIKAIREDPPDWMIAGGSMDGARQNCVVKVNGVNVRAGWELLAIVWEMSLGKEDETSPP